MYMAHFFNSDLLFSYLLLRSFHILAYIIYHICCKYLPTPNLLSYFVFSKPLYQHKFSNFQWWNMWPLLGVMFYWYVMRLPLSLVPTHFFLKTSNGQWKEYVYILPAGYMFFLYLLNHLCQLPPYICLGPHLFLVCLIHQELNHNMTSKVTLWITIGVIFPL